MKWLKTYGQYKESVSIDLRYQAIDLMESLNIWHDALLSAIAAKEEDIFDAFSLPKDQFSQNLELDFLEDSVEFINSLSSIGLKKSAVQNTDDYQTFVNKPCKFMFIYRGDKNEIENPSYVIFQVWNESLNRWEDAKLYSVNDDVKKFYDRLASKTVEITDGDENYIYQTSNGSDWELQNSEKENDIYKKSFRKDELQQLLSDRNVSLTII
jgi:hypothetical protein